MNSEFAEGERAHNHALSPRPDGAASPRRQRSLTPQPPQPLHGRGGGQAGGVVGGGGEVRLRGLELGGDGRGIHRLHVERALGQHGEMAGVDLVKPPLTKMRVLLASGRVTSMMPGRSAEITGACPASTVKSPSTPGTTT